jgi:hypothetical protein
LAIFQGVGEAILGGRKSAIRNHFLTLAFVDSPLPDIAFADRFATRSKLRGVPRCQM